MQLPMPDLAMLVLADFKNGDGWNYRNWLLEAAQHSHHREVTGRSEVMERLSEA
jgi:hypothetical protein